MLHRVLFYSGDIARLPGYVVEAPGWAPSCYWVPPVDKKLHSWPPVLPSSIKEFMLIKFLISKIKNLQ